MEHEIIQDLLPLYHDGVCSEQSRAAVEEHLETCEACRKALADMDAPLPEAGRSAANDAAVVEKISREWEKDKWKARDRGAVIAAVVCLVLFGGYQLLWNVNWRQVDTADIEITELGWLEDGRVVFHMFVNDKKDLREVRYKYDDAGNMYIVPLRPVFIGDRQTNGGLWDWDYDVDVKSYNETAAERGVPEIGHIYLGKGEDAILLWEEGMELSAADGERWGMAG